VPVQIAKWLVAWMVTVFVEVLLVEPVTVVVVSWALLTTAARASSEVVPVSSQATRSAVFIGQ